MLLPVCSQPFHIFLDGLHKLQILFGRIGIIESQMERAVIFFCQAIIQQYGFCMPDMQISIWLRRESGADLGVDTLCQILIYFLLDKILGNQFFSHVVPPHST